MAKGRVVAGVVAPHPPHLIYAENPPQNEPRSEGGWEELRWGYERLRASLANKEFDTIVVHSPHWRTAVGHHFLAQEHFKGLSVDPVFPNLFRYHYDLNVDVELAKAMSAEGAEAGLTTTLMTNPKFRVDYGTIIACHLVNPTWDKPIVSVSANMSYFYFSADVGQRQMCALGEACARAIEKSGKRVLLVASSSLSHRHFTVEPSIPEDMSHEHIYNHNQYQWDMHMIDLMRQGKSRTLIEELPDFIEQSVSELDAGSLTWMMAGLGYPDYPATVHAYGTVIGTGNAVVEWDAARGGAS